MEQYTVIVNTTPLGMFPNIDSCPDIPYDLLTPNHLLYDLLYNPDETLFMKKGKEKGAVVKNGLEMLLLHFRRLGDLAEIDRTISFQPHDLMKLAS